MLKRVEIRNFRALEKVDLDLEPLTALIGPNSSGKSSILKALDILLGSAWPGLRSFQIPQDFTSQDVSRELSITADLDPPYQHEDRLKKTHDVSRLVLRCLPYKRKTARAEAGDLHADLTPLLSDGNIPTVATELNRGKAPTFRPLTVGTDMREHCGTLFIDHRRSLYEHQPWRRSSLLGRLLKPVQKELPNVEIEPGKSHEEAFNERYQQAMEALRTPKLKEIETIIGETTRKTLGFLGSSAARDVQVGFGFADPRNPMNSLRLIYSEEGVDMPSETLGLGVQSAIVVAIFEAFRQLGGKIGTVLVEEPEMYLHPQAQRYFYGLLCDLTDRDECQIIYSTHSPIFADVTRFEGIRLTRREPGNMAQVSAITEADDMAFLSDRRDAQKMLGFTGTRSELFFARKVLLVEGPADELAARHVANELSTDIDAEDLAIVGCGGKSGIPFTARVCRALEIPYWVLHDRDVYEEPEDDAVAQKVRERNAQEEKINGDVRAAVVNEDHVYTIEPSLEEALGISRSASDKPRRVADELQTRSLEDLPDQLVEAVKKLIEE